MRVPAWTRAARPLAPAAAIRRTRDEQGRVAYAVDDIRLTRPRRER